MKAIKDVTPEDISEIAKIQNQTLYSNLLKQGQSPDEISKIGFHLVPFSEDQLRTILGLPGSIFLKYEDQTNRDIEAYAFGFTKLETSEIVPRFERDVKLDDPSLDPRQKDYFFFRQIVKRRSLISRGPIALEREIIRTAFQRGHPVICGEICIDPRYNNQAGLSFHTRVGHFQRFGEVLVGGENEFRDVKLGCYYLTPEMFLEARK